MSKEPELPPLSPPQWEILDLVWNAGEITVGEVWGILKERRQIARNTVQTTMARLVDKGWLKHRAEGNTFFFKAALPRDKTRRRTLKQVLETAFQGSTEGLLLTLLGDQRLTAGEAERIRQMIDQAARKPS
jgi:predicted transcriptional regulator